MKNKLDRSVSTLASVLCCTLGSGLVIVSCLGTETDNPVAGGDVFDGTSPENLGPQPGGIPPCIPTTPEEEPMAPRRLTRSVVVPSASGRVIATGGDAAGLSLVDVSDPENPVELSRGVVRGEIHQLLVASSGELWVLATEPPAPAGNAVPSPTSLDPVLRLVRVDVTDPAAPARIAEASLEGDRWELRERNGEAWVLSARRHETERGCAAQENSCGYRSYEALLLHGFRPNGAALEPIGQAELPFEQRAWWGTDGVVTALADGTLNAVGWAGSGALRSVLQVQSPGSEVYPGPAQVVGGELSVVRVAAGQARIDVYGLDSDATAPLRSLPLGPRAERAAITSLFAERHLWLQALEQPGNAELWDLTGTTPVRVVLPQAFHTVLPIEGASREGQPDEILALGASRDESTGSEAVTLLSIQGGVASVLEAPEPDATLNDALPAPAGITGAGEAQEWVFVARGPGSAMSIEPVLTTAPPYPTVTMAFVGVAAGGRAPGESIASEAITGVALVEAYEAGGRGAFTALELSGATPSRRIELSPLMRALAPTATGVATVAMAPASECNQVGVDCSGYAPGVSVFDLTGEPTLVASLPFPELPLPPIDDPNRLSVRWELYDPLTEEQPAALRLGNNELAFVASVDLSCDNQADCDALELTAVPIREANVAVGTPVECPPGSPPGCNATPPPDPTVYGTSLRQYFYVLDLDAAGGPAFEAWGVSRLAATAARTDRESRFAFPLATDGILAATRLERRRSATDLNDRGATRFFLDRFERAASGEIVALPAVNVPGYPVARVGGDAAMERWFSVEALPGETGAGRLHRMNVQSDGARIEQSLDLGGRFAGFRVLASGEAQLGLVLSTPDDGCGTSQLWSIPLGSDVANASEPLAIASTLELPSDDWAIAATDGDLALLQRDFVYVLVRVAPDGTLAVVSSSTLDVPLGDEQLLGTSVFGAAGQFGPRILDLQP